MQKPPPCWQNIFSKHEVFKVVVMLTRYNFIKNIFIIEKSPKNMTFNYKIINFPNIHNNINYVIVRNMQRLQFNVKVNNKRFAKHFIMVFIKLNLTSIDKMISNYR